MIRYFESGQRPSMLELCLLHAAARGQLVTLRGEHTAHHARRPGEDAAAFLDRLRRGEGALPEADAPPPPTDDDPPLFAALHQGDLTLPRGSESTVLFPGRCTATLTPADLIR